MIHPVIDLDIPESVGGLINVQTLRRINAVLQAQTSPFYAGQLDGIDVNTITQPDHWSQLPILETQALAALSPEGFRDQFCVTDRRGIAEFWRAGPHLRGAFSYPRMQKDIIFALIGVKRALVLSGFADEDILQVALPFGGDPLGQLFARGAVEAGIGVIWAGNAGVSEQLDFITAQRPSGWVGEADFGIHLALAAQGRGQKPAEAGLSRILCSGAPLSDAKRRKLGGLWAAEVRDCWALPEMLLMGCEDAECFGYRFWSDLCFPEVLDEETLAPVGEGEPGVLVLTSLATNNATPFLRWNTGERVTLRSRRHGEEPFHVYPLVQPAPKALKTVAVGGVAVGVSAVEDALLVAEDVVDFHATLGGGRFEVEIEVPPGADKTVIGKRVAERVYQAVRAQPEVRIAGQGALVVAREVRGDYRRVALG